MPAFTRATVPTERPIRNLRWWICALLFASTVINYIDRQTLSLLSPYLKQLYHWTNSDYANLLIGFRVAYSIGQSVCGRLMDRVGTRRGLTLSVLWYSIVSMATSLAGGFYSFATFRFLLGAGESANWPGATKAVSEWFPKRERALATALFDSGSSIGGAIAPFLVLWIYFRWGWRPAVAVPGALGFLWLIAWRLLYHPPEVHSRISQSEREMIAADLGSFFAGWLSGYSVRRGMSLGWARKVPVICGGFGMTLVIPTIFTTNEYAIATLFAFVTFTYAGFTIMANTLPSDLFHSDSVASVSGVGGTGTGLGTIVAFKLIGYVSDARQATGTHAFDPIIILAGIVPFVGMILVLLLVRNNEATERGLVRRL